MESALISFRLLNFLVEDKGLEGLGGGRCAVQRRIADGGRGSGLIGQWLRDLEIVQRWRTNGPRIAENGLVIAVKDGELGRVGLSC